MLSGASNLEIFGFGGSGKLILNPRELTQENCLDKINVVEENLFLNQEKVLNQLRSADISPFNSFLSKYHRFFTGQVFNMADCPPGFEGPLCQPCRFGYFKPFYGTRKCVECPCKIAPVEQPGSSLVIADPSLIFVNFSDCQCAQSNWAKRNFGYIFFFMFIFVGLIVFSSVNIYKRINMEQDNDFRIRDIADFVFKIPVFGTNSFRSPLQILSTFSPEELQVLLTRYALSAGTGPRNWRFPGPNCTACRGAWSSSSCI